MAGTLKLVQVESNAVSGGASAPEWRHELDGRAVSDGELLRVYLGDGTRVVGRYAWSGRAADNPMLAVQLAPRIPAELAVPPGARVERLGPCER